MQPYLSRQQALEWYVQTRQQAIDRISSDGAGKVKFQCPLCPSMGEFTIIPASGETTEKYNASFFCAECGFRIDDSGLKYFPPPPPPKHLRIPKYKR
jgi:predicted RNA-binding Zn-ribbon protein involved in translation (DUF1610 family)